MTLVEVTLVVALMGIVLAAGAPRLSKIQNEWDLWGAMRTLESSLCWARFHAVSSNSSLIMVVGPDGRTYYWTDETGLPYALSYRNLPREVLLASAPRRSLRFFPHGNAAPAGTFVLQGKAGSYRVIASPIGRIRTVRD